MWLEFYKIIKNMNIFYENIIKKKRLIKRLNETDDSIILQMLWDVEVAMSEHKSEINKLIKILRER
jgi:hypothetical protein